MKTVRIAAGRLKEVLNINLVTHLDEYEEAVEGYREELEEVLEAKLTALRKGDLPDHYINLPIPESHEGEYRRAISMLEMSEDDIVELDQTEFSQYVLDEWNWKGAFTRSISNYKKG